MERVLPKDIPLDQLLAFMQYQTDDQLEAQKEMLRAGETTQEEAVAVLDHMDGIILALQELMHLKGVPHSPTCPMAHVHDN